MAIYKINETDPEKYRWDNEPASTKELDVLRQSDGFKLLSKGIQDAAVAELVGSETVVKPSENWIAETTQFISLQNMRVRSTYKARKDGIIQMLQGNVDGATVDRIRKLAELSPEQLKQTITTGLVKDGKVKVSNGVPIDGVEMATIAYLDELIQDGKKKAAVRRAKAEANKSGKGD